MVKKQRYKNSCGAATLLCAANELGIVNIPPNSLYTLWGSGVSQLDVDDICEATIYQVTSDNPDSEQCENWGYSMPSNMVKCANMLGLNARVVCFNTKFTNLIQERYRDEIRELNKQKILLEQSDDSVYINQKKRARKLTILGNESTFDLHYIMVRPDGSAMDPYDGRDYIDIKAVELNTDMQDTGFSVFVFR